VSGPFKVTVGFAAAAALLIGVLAWLTGEALRLEDAREKAQADASIEEKVRLALWRLESAVTPILAVENLESSRNSSITLLRSKGNPGAKAVKTAKDADATVGEEDKPGAIDFPRFVRCRFTASCEGTEVCVPKRRREPALAPAALDREHEAALRNRLEGLLREPLARLAEVSTRPQVQAQPVQEPARQAQERSPRQQVQSQTTAQAGIPAQGQTVAQVEQQLLNSNEWQARSGNNRLLGIDPTEQASSRRSAPPAASSSASAMPGSEFPVPSWASSSAPFRAPPPRPRGRLPGSAWGWPSAGGSRGRWAETCDSRMPEHQVPVSC
jgi:hypothetical protein